MGGVEKVAALLGVLNILLLVRRSVWNYAFGLAMVALYAPVFYQAKLYSDALLQLIFFAAQLYGLWNWRRSQAESGDVVVERLGTAARLGWAAATLVAIGLWGAGMARFTDAAFPYLDATNAIVSVVAQILLSKRLIENWLLWIFVDVIQIALYIAKDLRWTAALYVLFLVMSAWGWIEWRRNERRPLREALA